MADMLGFSASAYARLERNETSIEIDQMIRMAQVLQVPIQEFLPETLSIQNHNHNGQGGLIFGNFYYYADNNAVVKDLTHQLQLKEQEISFLKEKIALLEKLI